MLMIRNKSITLEIIGHTDDVGSKDANLNISLKRAQMVADYLLSKGIEKNRLTVTGKMDSEPLFPNNTPANRAKNRRVEFIIMN
jgi:outer membrane protein OmpA-like peptidoglycan-associated protein